MTGVTNAMECQLGAPCLTPAARARTPDSRSLVLAVDDTLANLKLLEQVLTTAGHQVVCVGDGPGALELARRAVPDLILLDVRMPGMDGFAVCARLKQDPVTRDIPVIFVTAQDDHQTEARGMELGAADFVTKPFNVLTLLARVKTQLALVRQHSNLREMVLKVVEFAPDAFILSDEQDRIVSINGCAEALYGHSRQEVLGDSLGVLVTLPASPMDDAQGDHVVEFARVVCRRKDGTTFLADVRQSSPLANPCRLAMTVVRDVTAQHEAQCQLAVSRQALQDSEERLRAIFDASPNAQLISDVQGVIRQANAQAAKLLRYSMEELVGLPVESLVPHGARAAHVKHRADFAKAPVARRMGPGLALKALRRDGSECDVEVGLSRIQLPQGPLYVSSLHDVSERKGYEERLQQQNNLLTEIIRSVPGGVMVVDADLRLVTCNDRFEQMMEYPSGLLATPGLNFEDLARYNAARGEYGPGEASAHVQIAMERARSMGPHRFERVRPNGVVLEVRSMPLAGGGFVAIYIDITEQRRAEEQLRIAAAAFESQEGMVVTDVNTVILRVNRAFTESTGYSAQEIVGQTPRVLQSGRHGAPFFREMWETITNTGGWQGEIWDRRKNGEVYPKWLTISAVKGDDGAVTHYIGTHYDITHRKRAEQRINELAFFDQLTGLPNRTLLLDRLRQAMTASGRSEQHGALLFIDLDNFKILNDTLGHDVGDQLLKQAAQRLIRCTREGDTVARLGGDEFVVVLTNLSRIAAEAGADAETVARKILGALNQRYLLGDVTHHSTASIGLTLFRGTSISIDDLLRQADLTMYKSKAAGRNTHSFFDPAMAVAVKERAAMEADLRRAIEHRQFALHYQAQVGGEGQVIGAEALLRWHHPDRGMVSPAEFISLAEETGLILPLGRWVLQSACLQLARWAHHAGTSRLTLAVNVSAHQFRQPGFVDQVLHDLSASGADAHRLKLELTESLMVQNVAEITEVMLALRAVGVSFSLDDFGTGYSSLAYLKRMPLDQLKIDRSFVHDVLIDSNDAAIARTIVALADSLGLSVIAEGVENEAQRAFLASQGCHVYQGYLFSQALPIEQFDRLVGRSPN